MLIGIVVLALGIRLTVALVTTSWVFSSNNNFWRFGYEMGEIASSLAMGNGFSWPAWTRYYWPQEPTAWMPPVYPLIMAAAFKGLGIYSEQAAITLELFQMIISVLTCVVLYNLGKRLYNAQVGLLAAFLLAIYPAAIHFAVQKIWSTSLFTCCLLLVIIQFLRQAEQPHIKGGVYLGTLLGFTALTEPAVVSAYPFATLWLYLKANGEWGTVTKTVAAMLIAFFLSISPWLVRNYIVFEQFVFIKSNLGTALFMGNNPGVLTEAEREHGRLDEVNQNRLHRQKAITLIRKEPLSFIQRTITRFTLYWTFMRPKQFNLEDKVSLAAYFMMLSLAVAGLLRSGVKAREVQLVMLFLLLFPISYYLTIVDYFRYRFPLEPILMVFAGYTIYCVACRYREKHIPPNLVVAPPVV